MGTEDEPLDGCGDTDRAEGRGEAGWRVADGDGGEQGGLQVLQGGGGGAVAARPEAAPYHGGRAGARPSRRQDGGSPCGNGRTCCDHYGEPPSRRLSVEECRFPDTPLRTGRSPMANGAGSVNFLSSFPTIPQRQAAENLV